jgi:hypothetical protein
MTDFSKILNEEDIQTQGASGGGFKVEPPAEGVALFRLREVIEFGCIDSEYKGTPKKERPVSVVFELVHPRHAIHRKNDDGSNGEFIRNHEVTVRLNKSNSEKSKYMKLFNKLNFDGRVSAPKGKVPSFAAMLGDAFLGEIHHNSPEGSDKVYVNVDKDGEFTIGAPRVATVDEMGAPTGDYKAVPVPEMAGEQRCFLWETNVSDEVYRMMWDSIEITGEKNDGTPRKNWIQEAVSSEENIEWAGSRAESLFGASAELNDLTSGVTTTEVEDIDLDDDIPFDVTPQQPKAAEAPAEDPLAALGL